MIIDVKTIVEEEKEKLKRQISILDEKPILEIISTSDDQASKVYVKNKIKTGSELGIDVRLSVFADSTTKDIVSHIKNSDADGIIVQLPLSNGLDKEEIIKAIPKEKDIDGFGETTINDIFHTGMAKFEPCTPKGILLILKRVVGDLTGKNITIINRSDIVGKPLALMLINLGATVTVCNSHTDNLNRCIQKADIVITAIGKANYFNNPEVFKYGGVIIDVSINRDENGKLCGDCSKNILSSDRVYVTPVPGGIGLTTVLSLMQNTLETKLGI